LSHPTVSSLGEHALIARITARLAMPSWVVVGPGRPHGGKRRAEHGLGAAGVTAFGADVSHEAQRGGHRDVRVGKDRSTAGERREPEHLAAAVAAAATAPDWRWDDALLTRPLHLRAPATTGPRS